MMLPGRELGGSDLGRRRVTTKGTKMVFGDLSNRGTGRAIEARRQEGIQLSLSESSALFVFFVVVPWRQWHSLMSTRLPFHT